MISLAATFAPLLLPMLATLAQSDPPVPGRSLFLAPLPAWSNSVWPWLLLPLCVAIDIVYKCIRCRSMSSVPREAAVLTVWIVAGMGLAALALAGLVEILERTHT